MDEPLNEPEMDLATIAQMALHGSPFVRRLGQALGFADYKQTKIVREAFPEIWTTYAELARRAEGRAA